MPNDKNTTKEFSIAAQKQKEQIQREEEEKRLNNIKKLANDKDRHQHEQMIAMRDVKLQQEQERAKREEEAVVQREIQRRSQPRLQMNLVMASVRGKDPQQIEQEVRAAVRAVHGAELDNHRDSIRATMNREIDASLKAAQDRERGQARQKEFQENARKITTESLKRPWEGSVFSRDKSPRRDR